MQIFVLYTFCEHKFFTFPCNKPGYLKVVYAYILYAHTSNTFFIDYGIGGFVIKYNIKFSENFVSSF